MPHSCLWVTRMANIRNGMVLRRRTVMVFVFETVSGCDQLVIGSTHARGGTLDLLMTDVSDLVLVTGIAPLASSDHSSLSTAILMGQAVPNLC